ncbi:MAG TPA: hypothetical protein VJA21_28215, partial [Verrucomicrobiae bacterium]
MKSRLPIRRSALVTRVTMLAVVSLPTQPLMAQEVPAAPVKRLLHFRFQPEQPNSLTFPPTTARFIRLTIQEAEGGQPCLDEMEVYEPAGTTNLALAN